MKKYLLGFLLIMFVIPSIAFASWWNPFSWKIFNKNLEPKIEDAVVPVSQVDKDKEIEKLKKEEVEGFKKKTNSVVSTSKPPIKTWEELEVKYFLEANQKGYIYVWVENFLGEKRYYRKEGTQWVRKNSEAEAKKPLIITETTAQEFERPIAAPSPEEMYKMMTLCNFSEEVKALCATEKFTEGFFTNLSFRKSIIDMAIDTETKLAKKKAQDKLSLQRYLLYKESISQPTFVPYTQTHYETYKVPSYESFKLKSNNIISNTPIRWNIQWTGNGSGFITNSLGSTTNFHCDNITNSCFSL